MERSEIREWWPRVSLTLHPGYARQAPAPRKKSSAKLSPLAPAALSSSRLVRGGARHLEWRAAAGQGRRPTMAPRSSGRGSRRLDEWSAGRASPRATAGARPRKARGRASQPRPKGACPKPPAPSRRSIPRALIGGTPPAPAGKEKGRRAHPGPGKQQGRRRAPDRVPWCLSWRLPWRRPQLARPRADSLSSQIYPHLQST